MPASLRPEDIKIGSFGQNFLDKVKALVEGGNAILKGDSVVIAGLNFDRSAQQTPRSATVTRSNATPSGMVWVASNAAAVGRQVVLVKWLPLAFTTTGAAQGDLVYIDDDGSPTLAVKTVIIGKVVDANLTAALGGSIILESPGIV